MDLVSNEEDVEKAQQCLDRDMDYESSCCKPCPTTDMQHGSLTNLCSRWNVGRSRRMQFAGSNAVAKGAKRMDTGEEFLY
eukprot:5198054-Karenia_brevis.AAC.1